MSDRLKVLPQYLLPKLALTRLAGAAASHAGGALTHAVIRWFIKRYKVNMSEALHEAPEHYARFNEFFTRELKPGARPLAKADWICPVDGAISQFGAIAQDQIFQAKGQSYSCAALLASTTSEAQVYEGGQFACLYLSPRDYHRIHMPIAGELRKMVHVPGDLFSVNPTTARGVPKLFARNERVVCHFDTAHGPFVLVLVGATIVGSMATVWHGVVNPPRPQGLRSWDYADGQVRLAQGAEMGRFLLGSTVVMLWPKAIAADMRFNSSWQPAGAIRLGEAMATLSSN
jgi:phosphatidylserine decarboxylase